MKAQKRINIDNSIFILGCHKSGTTLVRNLLDGHADLFVVPFESHFFQNINYWVDYEFRKTKPKEIGFHEKKANLLEWIKYSNSVENKLADGFTKNKWNIKRVNKILQSQDVKSNQELLSLYFLSIYEGITIRKYNADLRFVEKSVEHTEFAVELKQMMPDSTFIHVLRNPYSNLVSLRKYMAINRYNNEEKIPFYKKAIKVMYNSYYHLYKNQKIVDDYKVVLYEDLLKSPQKMMRELCDFLRITFQEVLLTPTHLGKTWAGNSTSGQKFKGVSADNLNKWKGLITEYEIHLVNKYFDFVLDDFGYERLSNQNLTALKKESGEGVREYIANRVYFGVLT